MLLSVFAMLSVLAFAQNAVFKKSSDSKNVSSKAIINKGAKTSGYLLQEGFESGLPSTWTLLDMDADGYNWVDALTIANTVPGASVDVVSGFINSGSNSMMAWSFYPTSFDSNGWGGESLVSVDYLITPQIQVPSNGVAVLSYYVRNINTMYADEFAVKISTTGVEYNDFSTVITNFFEPTDGWVQYSVSLQNYAGQNVYIAFVHSGSDDMGLCLDDVEISYFDEPILEATPETLNFALNFGDVCTPKTVSIVAYNLTEDIAATATENFEVSSNGTDFSSSVVVSRNGGNLYVRYAPTAAGSHSGTVSLESGETVVEIALSGSAADCSGSAITTFPYFEDFEAGIPACWTLIDADGDGENWISSEDYEIYMNPTEIDILTAYAGENAVCSRSFDNIAITSLNVSNYLVTPAIVVPADARISFYAQAFGGYWDKFKVLVSTTGVDVADFTGTLIPLTSGERNWTMYEADLSAY
ncbi:MAG: hypothetical protein HUK15_00895, partial [Bacteroidales bacterium]|nr:hypothetical protein [Bacteroidales bacterium]